MLVDVRSPREVPVCKPFNVTCDITLPDNDLDNINYVEMARWQPGLRSTKIMFNAQLTETFVRDKYNRYRATSTTTNTQGMVNMNFTLMVVGNDLAPEIWPEPVSRPSILISINPFVYAALTILCLYYG